jgi:hypothetical protein
VVSNPNDNIYLDQLHAKQQDAVVELLNQPTVRKAAEAVGVNEKTVHRWLRDPTFSAAYREARRLAFRQAMSLTQRYAPIAIQTLAKVMTDEKAPAGSRVSAAEAILRFSRDSIELDDLEERVAALEAAKGVLGLPPTPPAAPPPLPPGPEPSAPEPLAGADAGEPEQRREAA